MEHYRSHKAYIHKKRAERISNTGYFFPIKFIIPKISSTDSDIHPKQYLINAIQNPAPDIPLVTLRNSQNEALIALANIFDKATSPEIPPRVVQTKQHQHIIENLLNKHAQPPRVPIVVAKPDGLQ